MDISVKPSGTLSYWLEIKATAEDLKPDIDREARKRRSTLQLKGFRVGKVPLSMVLRLYGKEIAQEAVNNLVAECYEDLVTNSPEYDLWEDGPNLAELQQVKYTYGEDLVARLPFMVRPEFTVEVPETIEVEFPSDDWEADLVEEYVSDMTHAYGHVEPLEDGALLELYDKITYDIQEVDPGSYVPIVGTLEEGCESLLLADPSHSEFFQQLCAEVVGREVGETVRFTVTKADTDSAVDPRTEHMYAAKICSSERLIPAELDAELARAVLDDQESTLDDLWQRVHLCVKSAVDRHRQGLTKTAIRRQILDHNEIPVPQLALELGMSSVLYHAIKEVAPPSEVEALIEDVEDMIRWDLCKRELAQRFGIEVARKQVSEMIVREIFAVQVAADLRGFPVGEFLDGRDVTAENVKQEIIETEIANHIAENIKVTVNDEVLGLAEAMRLPTLYDEEPEPLAELEEAIDKD